MMRRYHYRDTGIQGLLHQRAQAGARACIHSGMGLIEQQHIRLANQRTREQHPPQLSV